MTPHPDATGSQARRTAALRDTADRAALMIAVILIWADLAEHMHSGRHVALLAGVATLGVLTAWLSGRVPPIAVGAGALLLGVLWSLAALQAGSGNGRDVSGVLQLGGGATLATVGVRTLLSTPSQHITPPSDTTRPVVRSL